MNAPSEAAGAEAEPASGVTCKDEKLNTPPPAPEQACAARRPGVPTTRTTQGTQPPPGAGGFPRLLSPLQGDRHSSGEQGGERSYLDTLAAGQHSFHSTARQRTTRKDQQSYLG